MTTGGAPRLAQLERTNLREQARGVLRTSIITGELEPDVLYTIGEFATRLGVSATPVREALGDLAQVGLVEIIRNRGFVVLPLADHDLDEILQIRLMLEPPALMEVAGKLTPQTVRRCQELVNECKSAAAVGDLNLFLESDRDFHLGLISPLGNRRLVQILSRLRDEVRLYGLRELAAAGRLVKSAEEHEVILDAVVNGRIAETRDAITRHLRHTRGTWAGLTEVATE